jgi:hypothetical protein
MVLLLMEEPKVSKAPEVYPVKSGDCLVPEQKPLFRQNPNTEIRKPKQIRISNDKTPQTNHASGVVQI